jgi:hypothetical protein
MRGVIRWNAFRRSERVSIAVEDWDDLVDEPRRRGKRGRQPEQQAPPAREPAPQPAPAAAREPRPFEAQSPVREPAPAPTGYEPAPERAAITVYEPPPVQAPSPAQEPVATPEPGPVHEPSPAPAAVAPVPETSPLPAPGNAPRASPVRARIAERARIEPADVAGIWDELDKPRRAAPAAAPEPPPEVDMGVANFADDSYGDTYENLRIPAGIAGVNALFWLIGRVFGVVELVGVAFFVAVGLLLTAYVMREWQRDRTSLICLAGALPLPLTIIGVFV